MMVPLAFFVVSLVGFSQAFLDDRCNLMTVSDLSKDSQVIQMPIPDGCITGEVEWHYPKGNLLLEARLPAANSVLCIEESWATMIGAVMEVTGGMSKPMALPTKDSPSCSSQPSAHPQVMLTAEDTQYYMTAFKYSIKMIR
ncbi:hypothetical protein EGW08_022425 [Elysia chlorotica]|uniref:Reelin domain-containing protein n=1 Tax=Elysia chlorotica TaxID=188477 RepID=A0A3S1B1S2_ELYCH|nr:hypothetical protein EGW08_022425 [Elysia chlorotica]